MLFTKLDDSPALRKQLTGLEDGAHVLNERCEALLGASTQYTEFLGEAAAAELAFVQALEEFCGTDEDPLAVSIGGPIMRKFVRSLQEVFSFKETLKFQMDHLLRERLSQFADSELAHVKEVRRRFDKATLQYDHARQRVLSLHEGAHPSVVAEEEENLATAKMQAEQTRFNLVTALSSVEARKKYLFLESIGSVMDALLRYYKQSFELLKTMEPYIHQVLSFAHQAHEQGTQELSELAERMYALRQQREKESEVVMQASRMRLSSAAASSATPSTGNGQGAFDPRGPMPGTSALSRSSSEVGEGGGGGGEDTKASGVMKLMRENPGAKVHIIKEGYLIKRSKDENGYQRQQRFYFVLDSRGALYHRTDPATTQSGGAFSMFGLGRSSKTTAESSASQSGPSPYAPLGFFPDDDGIRTPPPLPSPSTIGGTAPKDTNVTPAGKAASKPSYEVVNLLTATVKMDGEQPGLRCCFRVVSPGSTWTLQAENETERSDWMENVTAVIVSLLNTQELSKRNSGPMSPASNPASPAGPMKRSSGPQEAPVTVLQRVEGNSQCADCGQSAPDWASLNLCVLVCIHCSGIHRKLGVHVSKVRSLTLDVRVWTLPLVQLLSSIGNTYANLIWEVDMPLGTSMPGPKAQGGMQHSKSATDVGEDARLAMLPGQGKPRPDESADRRERYIYCKYVKRQFISDCREQLGGESGVNSLMRSAVADGDARTVLHLLVSAGVMADGAPRSSPLGKAPAPALEKGAASLNDDEDDDGFSALANRSRSDRGPGRDRGFSEEDEDELEMQSLTLAPRDSAERGSNEAGSRLGSSGALEGTPSASTAGTGALFAFPPVGTSLLHIACEHGHAHIVELLLMWGASASAVDEQGRSPRDVALAAGHKDCARLLVNR